LRDDQRSAGADLAVLVSVALPNNLETSGRFDVVWMTKPGFNYPLAIALRQQLMEATASMYVDLEGFEGKSLQEIGDLEMPLLETHLVEDDDVR
jgi:hypothetical protein